MMREDLKKETEELIMATQYQSLRANAFKAKIEKTTSNVSM